MSVLASADLRQELCFFERVIDDDTSLLSNPIIKELKKGAVAEIKRSSDASCLLLKLITSMGVKLSGKDELIGRFRFLGPKSYFQKQLCFNSSTQTKKIQTFFKESVTGKSWQDRLPDIFSGVDIQEGMTVCKVDIPFIEIQKTLTGATDYSAVVSSSLKILEGDIDKDKGDASQESFLKERESPFVVLNPKLLCPDVDLGKMSLEQSKLWCSYLEAQLSYSTDRNGITEHQLIQMINERELLKKLRLADPLIYEHLRVHLAVMAFVSLENRIEFVKEDNYKKRAWFVATRHLTLDGVDYKIGAYLTFQLKESFSHNVQFIYQDEESVKNFIEKISQLFKLALLWKKEEGIDSLKNKVAVIHYCLRYAAPWLKGSGVLAQILGEVLYQHHKLNYSYRNDKEKFSLSLFALSASLKEFMHYYKEVVHIDDVWDSLLDQCHLD